MDTTVISSLWDFNWFVSQPPTSQVEVGVAKWPTVCHTVSSILYLYCKVYTKLTCKVWIYLMFVLLLDVRLWNCSLASYRQYGFLDIRWKPVRVQITYLLPESTRNHRKDCVRILFPARNSWSSFQCIYEIVARLKVSSILEVYLT